MIQYLKILEDLERKFKVTEDYSFGELVNFKINKRIPIHRWFNYIEGYSDQLVRSLLKRNNVSNSDYYVLDPFVGVGTTLVTSQSLGISSIGLEVNPVASFATKVKTFNYTKRDISEIESYLSNLESYLSDSKIVPKYKKLRNIFTDTQLNQILKIKGFYENIDKEHIRNFFKLAYLSIIEDCSNRVKDGNGIKIAKRKQPIEFVTQYFVEQCNRMTQDLKHAQRDPRSEVVFIHGSILESKIKEKLKKFPISMSIFSPPYANCFDYCEQYKMEIWLGDFVTEYEDFKEYRKLAIRSHVNAKFDPRVTNYNSEVEVIASLVSTYNIWNKDIPNMLRGYFDDMEEVIGILYSLLIPGALCFIVVANSSYKGIIVPSDLILANISRKKGFKVKEIISARRIRASSQQISHLQRKSHLMRESIITLYK